jgi:hypothetical protein
MSEGRTIIMRDPVQGHKAMVDDVWPWCKAMLMAERKVQLVAKPAKRTQEHSARLHAMLGWISKHIEWAGAKRDIDTWKRLLTAAWCRARGEHVAYLPALDGHGIDIVFRRTSEMTGAEMAELIEFIFSWAAQAGYQVPEVQTDGQVVYRGARNDA